MDLNEIRNRINYIVGIRKSKEHLLSPEDFNDLLKVNSLKHFKTKVGLPEAYRVGLPLPMQVYEQTKKNSNDLRPFKIVMGEKDKAALKVDKLGYATIPDDMYYPSSMLYKEKVGAVIKNRVIDIVTDLDYLDRLHSNIKAPTYKNPIANFRSTYIAFMPRDLRFVIFTYLKYPREPYYAVQSSEDSGVVVYDEFNSIQLEWDDINTIDIIALMLEDIGISIEAQEVMLFSDKEVKEGT